MMRVDEIVLFAIVVGLLVFVICEYFAKKRREKNETIAALLQAIMTEVLIAEPNKAVSGCINIKNSTVTLFYLREGREESIHWKVGDEYQGVCLSFIDGKVDKRYFRYSAEEERMMDLIREHVLLAIQKM